MFYIPGSDDYMDYDQMELDYYSDRLSGSKVVVTICPITGEYVKDSVKNLIRKNEAYKKD